MAEIARPVATPYMAAYAITIRHKQSMFSSQPYMRKELLRFQQLGDFNNIPVKHSSFTLQRRSANGDLNNHYDNTYSINNDSIFNQI